MRCAASPFAIALLFDISSSVSQKGFFQFQQQAAAAFLKQVMKPADRAAIFTIATEDIAAALARFERARPHMSTTPALDPASVELELVTAVTGVVTPATAPAATMEG